MLPTLIPAASLKKADKILFITHLALGDFTYLQNFFQAFKRAHPQLKLHLWIDEVRRTSDPAQWRHLEKYSLYDWVAACPCFDRIYTRTYSPALYQESLITARQEHYPIVVSLATLRPHRYAALARSISPDGLVIGMRQPARFYQPHHRLAYRKLDAAIHPGPDHAQHISDVYAHWFQQISGLEVAAADRLPFVDIPARWQRVAQEQLSAWGFKNDAAGHSRLVFINPYAKTRKRCWPLERVAELILAMKQQNQWRNGDFIINAVPQELARARQVIGGYRLERAALFSAEDNFFQLPAILARCDLIISVETAVMHLANAVHVPVIALMRRKNPEWAPIDRASSTVITTRKRRDWIAAITVEQVMKALP